jgi:hypothetical protein
MTQSESILNQLIEEIMRARQVVCSVKVDEFLEFQPHYKSRYQAHFNVGFSSVDEFVSRGGRRSIFGQGSTREEALADLVAELSGKKIAGYNDRAEPLYEVGELTHAA